MSETTPKVLGTIEDSLGSFGGVQKSWMFEGKTFQATVRPLSFPEELHLTADGLNLERLTTHVLDNCVTEASVPFDALARQRWSPAFGWAAVRGLGIVELYKRIGFSISGQEAEAKK